MMLAMAVRTEPAHGERLTVVVVMHLHVATHAAPAVSLSLAGLLHQQAASEIDASVAASVGALPLIVGEIPMLRPRRAHVGRVTAFTVGLRQTIRPQARMQARALRAREQSVSAFRY